MNYMKQVADMLGVEIGEKFNIRYISGNCFRTEAEAEKHKPEMLAKMKEVMER